MKENDPIKNIQISGVTVFPIEQLKRNLKSKVNSPYNFNYISDDKNELESLYHDMGYDLMVVESIQYSKDGSLIITINEGKIEEKIYTRLRFFYTSIRLLKSILKL